LGSAKRINPIRRTCCFALWLAFDCTACATDELRADVKILVSSARVSPDCVELGPVSASDGAVGPPTLARTGSELSAKRELQDATISLGGNTVLLAPATPTIVTPTDSWRGAAYIFEGSL
jgi:hypothetical protein